MSAPLKQKLTRFFFEETDAVRLDAFRVLIAVCMALYFTERLKYAGEWLTAEGFHVSRANLSFHPLSLPLMDPDFLPFFGLFFLGSILAVAVGWQLRRSVWALFACVVYVTFADQYAAFTVNKIFIFTLALLGTAAGGGYFSVEPEASAKRKSVWPIRILQMSFLMHYFTAGWQKAVFGDWLSNPFVLYTQLQGVYRTGLAAWLYQHLPVSGWAFMQYTGLAFELLAPLLFAFKATRRTAFVWGLSFQLVLALCMHQLIYFMLVMSSFYVLFLDDGPLWTVERKIRENTWKLA